MHTAQETFDHIVACLREQGAQSLTPNGHCAYRGDFGRKCAAGWCIDDELYDPEMEGKTAQGWVAEAVSQSGWDADVAIELQRVHDSATTPWEVGFKRVAGVLDLTYQEPAAT